MSSEIQNELKLEEKDDLAIYNNENPQNEKISSENLKIEKLKLQEKDKANVHESQEKNYNSNDAEKKDLYCWVCHIDGDVKNCNLCPRSFHLKCLPNSIEQEKFNKNKSEWVCFECQKLKLADSEKSILKHVSKDQFFKMLDFSVKRLKYNKSEAFQNSVDLKQFPDYNDFVVHPIDISVMEMKIQNRKYVSLEELLQDVKWLVHNCIVYNGAQNKLSSVAKALLRMMKHEINEIEVCSDCYLNSIALNDHGFSEPCHIPHLLVWAKIRGFPFWPAKVLRAVGTDLDVRFFGAHDRSMVSLDKCYWLSKEFPSNVRNHRLINMQQSIKELNLHIKKLESVFGSFKYAPPLTSVNINKPFVYLEKFSNIQCLKITNDSAINNRKKNLNDLKVFSPITSVTSSLSESKSEIDFDLAKDTELSYEDSQEKKTTSLNNQNESLSANEKNKFFYSDKSSRIKSQERTITSSNEFLNKKNIDDASPLSKNLGQSDSIANIQFKRSSRLRKCSNKYLNYSIDNSVKSGTKRKQTTDQFTDGDISLQSNSSLSLIETPENDFKRSRIGIKSTFLLNNSLNNLEQSNKSDNIAKVSKNRLSLSLIRSKRQRYPYLNYKNAGKNMIAEKKKTLEFTGNEENTSKIQNDIEINDGKFESAHLDSINTDSSTENIMIQDSVIVEKNNERNNNIINFNSSCNTSNNDSDCEEKNLKIKELKKIEKKLLKEKKKLELLEKEKNQNINYDDFNTVDTNPIPIKIKISRNNDSVNSCLINTASNSNDSQILNSNSENSKSDCIILSDNSPRSSSSEQISVHENKTKDENNLSTKNNSGNRINLSQIVRNCKSKLELIENEKSHAQNESTKIYSKHISPVSVSSNSNDSIEIVKLNQENVKVLLSSKNLFLNDESNEETNDKDNHKKSVNDASRNLDLVQRESLLTENECKLNDENKDQDMIIICDTEQVLDKESLKNHVKENETENIIISNYEQKNNCDYNSVDLMDISASNEKKNIETNLKTSILSNPNSFKKIEEINTHETILAEKPSSKVLNKQILPKINQSDLNSLNSVSNVFSDVQSSDLKAKNNTFSFDYKKMDELKKNFESKYNKIIGEIRYSYEQLLNEVKYNNEIKMREIVQESIKEKNKLKAHFERKISETKLKQWCANCEKEAIYYCCWNTSYCDEECQKIHWHLHLKTCSRINNSYTNEPNPTNLYNPNENSEFNILTDNIENRHSHAYSQKSVEENFEVNFNYSNSNQTQMPLNNNQHSSRNQSNNHINFNQFSNQSKYNEKNNFNMAQNQISTFDDSTKRIKLNFQNFKSNYNNNNFPAPQISNSKINSTTK